MVGVLDIGILPTPTPTVTATAFATPAGGQDGCAPPEGWVEYEVQLGNTLFAIARAVDSTVGELRDANCLLNVDNIYAGRILYVPREPLAPVATIAPGPADLEFMAPSSLRPVGCTDFSTGITSPRPGQLVSEVFTVFGTASLPNFQYYKIEIRPEFSSVYNFYDQFMIPVANGALAQINTALFGDGLHWIRLTVVDTTGNFPTPCEIPVYFP